MVFRHKFNKTTNLCYNRFMNDQVTPSETTEILRQAERALVAEGDFVELGCYKGTTSVLLGQLLQRHESTVENSAFACGKPVEKSHENVENLCKTPLNPVENFQSQLSNPSQISAQSKAHPQSKVQLQPQQSPNLQNSSHSQSSIRRLWIYDSFAGLPEKTREDSSGAGANFQPGELLVTKREVIDKLRKSGLKNVIVKKAWFDQLQDTDLPSKIAFAFCDGDLYASIKTSLRLVLPRLSPQGIIIVHDYNNPELPGSARAVDEFLRAHPDFQLRVVHTLAILTR